MKYNLLSALNKAHSPIRNYIIPGLTSWLIEEKEDGSRVRLLHCSRNHTEAVVPHSHRFDLQSTVLLGQVINVVWTPGGEGDLYCVSELDYLEEPGKYKVYPCHNYCYKPTATIYSPGQSYFMTADIIHSIHFTKDTFVLIEEGGPNGRTSSILQPVVDGKVVPTFKVEDWMFKRE